MLTMSRYCYQVRPFWMRSAALFSGWCIAVSAAVAGAAPAPVALEVSREAGRIDLRIRTTVEAPYAVIWAVLTDYDNTAKWVPDMNRSVVLRRKPGGAIVEQSGQVNVLVFRLTINSVVDVEEHPPDRIDVKLVRGDFKHLKGAYELKRMGDGVDRYELRWHGQLELATYWPGFVAQPLLTNHLKSSFEGLVHEMERRARVAQE